MHAVQKMQKNGLTGLHLLSAYVKLASLLNRPNRMLAPALGSTAAPLGLNMHTSYADLS